MEHLLTVHSLLALLTLTALEIVLGIDNIIFISILVDRLEKNKRESARKIGIFLAMFTRILLLLSLSWIISLTAPLFTVLAQEISGRDLALILGGLFLIAKSTGEIHHYTEADDNDFAEELEKNNPNNKLKNKKSNYLLCVLQIALIDIVFSLDSVITAIGLVEDIEIMITAIVISMFIMLMLAKTIGAFISKYPTLKLLALSFLLIIGIALIGDGLDFHIPKGYIYFAMGYALFVEILNMQRRKKMKTKPLSKQKDAAYPGK